MTIASIGDIEQMVQDVANLSRSLERQVLTNLSSSNLPKSDFAGVIAHKGKFTSSALRGSDFSGVDFTYSDLTGLCLDRLIYAALKGIEADLSKVTII